MTNEQEFKNPFPRLQAYLRKSVHINEPAKSNSELVRAAIKWAFDFTRNFMIVGAILFLAKKTGNSTLNALGIGGSALLLLYLWTYLDTWMLQPFHFLKNVKLALLLNGLVHLVVVVGIWVLLQVWLIRIVDQIAEGYLTK